MTDFACNQSNSFSGDVLSVIGAGHLIPAHHGQATHRALRHHANQQPAVQSTGQDQV